MKRLVILLALIAAAHAQTWTVTNDPANSRVKVNVNMAWGNVINATVNSLGAVLVGNGTTDNCAAFNTLQAAVPVGGILYVPSGRYHISMTACPNGFVFTRNDITMLGEGMGEYNGTGLANGTIFDGPIVTNVNSGITLASFGVDLHANTVGNTCISSGAATIGTMNGSFEHLTCVGNATAGHGLLIQSGDNNYANDIWAYGGGATTFHCVAIRSGHTHGGNFHCFNTTDTIVKSAAGSGNVTNVELANIDMTGSAANGGGEILVTGEGNGYITQNVTLNNMTCHNCAYGIVLETDTSGIISNVTATNFSGDHVGNCVYAYSTDSTGTIGSAYIQNVSCSYVSGNAFQNSHSAAVISLDMFFATAVGGAYMVGAFNTHQTGGWNLWSGNPNDSDLFIPGVAQNMANLAIGGHISQGSGNFLYSSLTWMPSSCWGASGIALLTSVTPTARWGETATQKGCWGNNGTLNTLQFTAYPIPSGQLAMKMIPTSDSDAGDIEIAGLNAAATAYNWQITKGGFTTLTGLVVPGQWRSYPNNSAGTTNANLVKINGGTLLTVTTADTATRAYIMAGGAGTTGNGFICITGVCNCQMDAGGATDQHYIGVSSSIAARCTDLGTTVPTTGVWIIGKATSNAAANANAIIDVSTTTWAASSSGSGISGGVSGNLLSATGTTTASDSGIVASKVTQTICSGQSSPTFGSTASNACSTVQQIACTGLLTTDNISVDFAVDPTATTGYVPGAMGTIVKYPTAGQINLKYCNNTGSTLNPTALALNYKVVR